MNLWFFIGFLFGILSYFISSAHIKYIVVVSISLFILSIILWRSYKQLSILLVIVVLGYIIGFGISFFRLGQPRISVLRNIIYTTVVGRVESVRPTTRGSQLLLSEIQFSNKDKVSYLHSNAIIHCAEAYSIKLKLGDKVRISVRLRPFQGSVLPHSYDFALPYHFAEVAVVGYAFNVPEVLEEQASLTLYKKLQMLRQDIYQKLKSHLPIDIANFAAAIMIGESKGLDREIMQNMRYAGISHILCVSGLHLTLVAMICFFVARILLNLLDYTAYNCNVKLISAILAWIGSCLYWLISGMNVATTRAFIMTSVSILAIIIGRKGCSIRSLGVAVFIILFLHPEDAISPSFQLSFGAVLALVSSYEFFIRYQPEFLSKRTLLGKVFIGLLSNMYSSIVVSLATAPIVVYHFYTFPNYTTLANLIAVPITSLFLMPLTILALVLMPFNCVDSVLYLLSWGIKVIISSAAYISSLPWSVWYIGNISLFSIVVYSTGWFWLSLWQTKWRFCGVVVILLSFVLMLAKTKVDIILQPNKNLLGIKNNNTLEIFGYKMSLFEQRYWANWFGQKDIKYFQESIRNHNWSISTASGNKVYLITRNFECLSADIVVNNIDDRVCSQAKIMITKSQLEELGTILLYCRKNQCYLDSDKYSYRFKLKPGN